MAPDWLQGDRPVSFAAGIGYNPDRDLFFRTSGEIPTGRLLSVCVGLGTMCNLRCSVCVASASPEGTLVDTQRVKPLLALLGTHTPLRVVWSGGEPTTHPGLATILEQSIRLGLRSVVATNALAQDPLRHLRGEFSYAVSIYGLSRADYAQYTGHDLFAVFKRRLEQMFSVGHRVSAYYRLDSKWRTNLQSVLSWIAQYPFRKLVLVTTIDRGRLDQLTASLSDSELEEVRALVVGRRLTFPTVVPTSRRRLARESGFVFMELVPDASGRVRINGIEVPLEASILRVKREFTAGNQNLFTLEDYVPPASA